MRMNHYLPIVLGALFGALLTGCTTGGAQPSRSQSQNNEFNDCTITINIGVKRALQTANTGAVTNDVELAASDYAERAAVEWFTLNQNQSGSETVTPTQTNTTDTKPDIDVTVPVNDGSSVASGASGVAGAVGTLAAAAASGIQSALSSDTKTTGSTATNGGTTVTECADGSCYVK